ncbi:putative T7SS-secreted protein [Streptomyces sp. NPDC050658]|uniref:putative T7SS-secreted protein n=1 Tax=unclassified Streptomyces TaxID=2593676 RepID=UPI00342B9481
MSDGQPPWLRPDPAADARFPALGFCPCPGDQRTATDVAGIVRRTADALRDIAHVLNGTGRGDWKGKAAEAFREQFHDNFRPKVNDARDSFRQAAQALEDWAAYMKRKQEYAEQLEGEAARAKERAGAAQKALDGLPPKPGFGDIARDNSHEDKAKRERQEADRSEKEQAAHTANADLEEIRGRAERLESAYAEEGEAVAGRLQHAMDMAPNEPGFWDRVGKAIGDFADAIDKLDDMILDGIKDFLKEYSWAFAFIGNVAGFLSSVIGLLSLAFPALAGLSLALAGVGLVAHYLQAVGETGSFGKALTSPTVLVDAAGLAFGGGAFAAMKGLKGMGAPAAGLFKTVLTQPGRVMGGTELGLKGVQFVGNWGVNSVGLGPGGAAQIGLGIGKKAIPGDQTKGPGKDVWPEALNPWALKEAAEK